MNETKKVADTLTEAPLILRIGGIPFKVKPLTIAQIWELGTIVNAMQYKHIGDDEKVNIVAEMLAQADNLEKIGEISTIIIFRTHTMRKLFGWWVKSHMTMDNYQDLLQYSLLSLRAAFFLISLTSLKGVKEMTSKTNTPEATPLGDSWVES